MKKSLLTLSTAILATSLSSCALISAPVKVASKAATTTIGVAGAVAKGGVGLLTNDDKDTNDDE